MSLARERAAGTRQPDGCWLAFAFLARDVGAATGLTLLGATWAGTALLLLSGSASGRSPALGLFLLTMAASRCAASSTILPIGRRGRAKSSIEGDISHQIEQAEREAGIRRQL